MTRPHCYPDFTLIFNVTNVRSGSPTGPDYDPSIRDLTGTATIQITDTYNQSVGDPSGPYDKSATTTSLSIPVPIDCVPTTDTTVGSTCAIKTTANTLLPGAAVAGKRAVLALGQVQLLDRGANGTPGDSDDRVFEAQGVFVP